MGKPPRREVVKPHAVLEVSDGVLDLGVAPMVGLQFQGLPLPVGDEAVIAVGGEEGQLGTGRGLDTADDEPHRHSVGLPLERSVFGLGHSGGALHPVRYGRPVPLGYGLDEVAQALVLADGDGETDLHLSAGGDDGMGVGEVVKPHAVLQVADGLEIQGVALTLSARLVTREPHRHSVRWLGGMASSPPRVWPR